MESQNGRIVVEEPRKDDHVSGAIDVRGLSDTYEARVVIRVREANGTVVAEASAEGGMMGLKPFSAHVVLDRQPNSSEGLVEVLEEGGKDNTVVEQVCVPVRFGGGP